MFSTLFSILKRHWAWIVLPAVVLWAVWPLAVHSWDHVVDTRAINPGMWQTLEPDIWLQIWILAWGTHALVTDPWSLYQGNAFHPTPSVIARSDHLLGMLPLFAPAYQLTGNPVFAFQFTLVASYVLCALSMYLLLRYVGCSRPVGVALAILWSLMWFRMFDGLARAQLLQYQYLPLVVAFFDRYLAEGRGRDLLYAGIALTWQSLTAYWHAYFAFYTAIVTIAVSSACLYAAHGLGRTAKAAAVFTGAAALLTAISLPYLEMAREGQLIPKSLPAGLSWYFGSPSFPYALSLAALAALPLLIVRPGGRVRRVGTCFVLIAAGGILCSLPTQAASMSWLDRILAMPRELAASFVPGFRYLRDEYRFLALASLGIYGLAAIGVEAGYRALRTASPVLAGSALAIYFGVLASPLLRVQFPLTPAPSTNVAPPVYQWLRDNGEGGTVLELPMSTNLATAWLEARYMFFSTYHWLPLINGYTGHPPRQHYERVRGLVARLPDGDAIEELRTLTGLRWIVIHDRVYEYFGTGGWQRSPHLKQIGDFGGAYLVEVAR